MKSLIHISWILWISMAMAQPGPEESEVFLDETEPPADAGQMMRQIAKLTNGSYVSELASTLRKNWALEKRLGQHKGENMPEEVTPLVGDIGIDLNLARTINAHLEKVVEKLNATGKPGKPGKPGPSARNERKIYQPSALCTHLPTIINYDIAGISGATKTGALEAMANFHATTCLYFCDATGSGLDVIRFSSNSGCYSYVCRPFLPSPTPVNLGAGCVSEIRGSGTAWHELAHALSMVHEHTRPDRNAYVVISGAVSSNYQYILCQLKGYGTCNPTVPYDFESVMHYGKSSSTSPNIVPVPQYSSYLNTYGQRLDGPSFLDTKAVNDMYCSGECSTNPCVNGGYPNPANCAVCNCPDGYGGSICDQVQASSVGTSCGGEIILGDTWQNLESPSGWPVQISTQQECIWHIKAPCGGKVQFQFTGNMYFNLKFSDGTCNFNYLELKYLQDKTRGGARYCAWGTYPGSVVESEDDTMVVKFQRLFTHYNGNAYYDYGFKAQIRAVYTPCQPSAPVCNGITLSNVQGAASDHLYTTFTYAGGCVNVAGGTLQCREVVGYNPNGFIWAGVAVTQLGIIESCIGAGCIAELPISCTAQGWAYDRYPFNGIYDALFPFSDATSQTFECINVCPVSDPGCPNTANTNPSCPF